MQTETEKEMNTLSSIMKDVLGEDITRKSNQRTVVDARKIFSKILIDRGYGVSDIGKYLKKDHSTIVYYSNEMKNLIEHNEATRHKYLLCKDLFLDGKIEYKQTKTEIEQQMHIISLNNQIEELILDKANLNKEVEKHKRIKNIIEFIESRTPRGKESFVLRKINLMFNGLTDYGQELD